MADESIWKKDLNFRKKSGPPTSQPAPAVPQGERPASIWKRELKFRAPFEVAETPAPEPAVDPAVAQAEPQEAQPQVELAPTTYQPLPEPAAPVPALEAQPQPSPEPAPATEQQLVTDEAAAQSVEPPITIPTQNDYHCAPGACSLATDRRWLSRCSLFP